MTDIIKIYNPDAAKQLAKADVAAMMELTTDQIKELAKAYPNKPTGNAYLILYDKQKKEKDQLYSLSTWGNLANLHKMGKTNFAAFTFRSLFNQAAAVQKVAAVQDLTPDQVKAAIGGVKKGVDQNLKEDKAAKTTATQEEGAVQDLKQDSNPHVAETLDHEEKGRVENLNEGNEDFEDLSEEAEEKATNGPKAPAKPPVNKPNTGKGKNK